MNARGNRKRSIEMDRHACRDVPGEEESVTRPTPAATRRDDSSPRRLPQLLIIASFVTFLDQFTKWIVVHRLGLRLHESIDVIPGIFSITRVHNSGIAFGLFPGLPDVFMVITLVSMLIVLYFYLTVEPRSALLTVGCALILGGAMGNLLDRFRLNYVVDFINFSFWPAFNIADSSVSIGVALLLADFFRVKKGTAKDASDPVQDRPV